MPESSLIDMLIAGAGFDKVFSKLDKKADK
jgi:hypothetical protein